MTRVLSARQVQHWLATSLDEDLLVLVAQRAFRRAAKLYALRAEYERAHNHPKLAKEFEQAAAVCRAKGNHR